MKEKMQIEYIGLSELKPYEKNPRINDDAAAKLEDSIRVFGFRVPMLIDDNNVIVAGHTRYKAAKSLGIDSVPCIRVTGLTDEQIKAFRIADNKYSELSHWDESLLKDELSFLKELDFNLECLGFNPYELQSYLEPFHFEEGEDSSFEEEVDENNKSNSVSRLPEGGRIIITYDNQEEFDWITKRLGTSGDKSKVSYRAKALMENGV